MKQRLFLTVVFGIALSAMCPADILYNVSLNTAPLIGNPNAPFALDFQLTSGNTTSGIVNSATLSQFSFGTGGHPGNGSPFADSGNASGNLSSTVALNTFGGTFFSEFSQFFTPGTLLSFQVDLTNNPQTGGTPDEFSFELIDKSGGEISSTDPSGGNSLVIIDLIGSTPQPQTYTTNGDGVSITPQLTSPSSSVPEAGTGWLFAIPLTLLVAFRCTLAPPK